jgi:hypothetical protein
MSGVTGLSLVPSAYPFWAKHLRRSSVPLAPSKLDQKSVHLPGRESNSLDLACVGRLEAGEEAFDLKRPLDLSKCRQNLVETFFENLQD